MEAIDKLSDEQLRNLSPEEIGHVVAGHLPGQEPKPVRRDSKGRRIWECAECSANFPSGKWLGCDGDLTRAHKVEDKVYYSPFPGLVLAWKMDRSGFDDSGNKFSVPGKTAMFAGGTYKTTDPEEQQHFEEKVTYLLTPDQFEELRLSDKVRAQRSKTRQVRTSRLLDAALQQLEVLNQEKAQMGTRLTALERGRGATGADAKPAAPGAPLPPPSPRGGQGRARGTG